jgi:hypothetical protein
MLLSQSDTELTNSLNSLNSLNSTVPHMDHASATSVSPDGIIFAQYRKFTP